MADKQQDIHINDLPYLDRQLVIVMPDEVVDTARETQKKEAASQQDSFDWKEIVQSVISSKYLTFSIIPTLTQLTIDAIDAWKKARESGLNVLQISQTEAKSFTFPPGHPKQRTLYVSHPALPSCYYTTASFHRMAFEHKFSEAIQLLMSLGATKIYVEHVRGWSRDFAGKMSAPLPNASAEAEFGHSAKSGSSLLFEASLNNKCVPSVPDKSVWYTHEPTWQSVAKGRLQFGLTQFSLTVNYEDDFGINAGIKVKAENAGLELGGSFESHTATTWKIYGDFGDTI